MVEQRFVVPLAAGSIPVTRPQARQTTVGFFFAYKENWADTPDSAQCSMKYEMEGILACMRLLYDSDIEWNRSRIDTVSCCIQEGDSNGICLNDSY